MSKLSTKHFIGLKDANENDIKLIIDTALTFREVLERPIKKIPSLKGKNIVNEKIVIQELIIFPVANLDPIAINTNEPIIAPTKLALVTNE